MSSTNRGAVRADHDFYETPQGTAAAVMVSLSALWNASPLSPRPPLLLDAGAGRGALVRQARAFLPERTHIIAVELQPAIGEVSTLELNVDAGATETMLTDFLTLSSGGYLDILVSNPPFELAADFVTHGLDDLRPRLAAFLLRVNYLGAQKRRDWWRAHAPDALRVLSERPRFDGPRECGRQAKGGQPACHVVWDRGPTRRTCPTCGWHDGGDSIEYGWFFWAADPVIKAALHEHPFGWY